MVASLVAFPPEPPQLSLLTMARRPQNELDTAGQPVGDRWTGGFSWLPEACGTIRGYNDCGVLHTVTYRDDAADPADARRYHQPVVLQAEFESSTFGFDIDYFRQRAVNAMLAAEPLAAEMELWDGPLARAATGIDTGVGGFDNNLWLTKHGVATDVTPTPGTPVKPRLGLALLEGFLADHGFGGRGMIHIPRELTPHLGVRVDGSSLLSNLNTLVVPGTGYSGRGPATSDGGASVAPDPGTAWAYVTDRVTYRNADIQVVPDTVAQAVDRSSNTARFTAERYSAATWDLCAVGAVLISTLDV